MNYKIFQPYYKKGQLETLDPEFTPYDNMANELPELREYHIFKSVIENGTVNDLDAWGFFSTRWKAKTRIKPTHFIDWIEKNPGMDVYLINPGIIQESVTINVWEQGEWYHPKMSQATEDVLKIMGIDVKLHTMLMTSDVYCFCSYFVGSKKFWTDYIEFLNKFVDSIELADKETKRIIKSNANYGKDMSLNYFPFIIERLFPTYLCLYKSKYKTISFPYQYQVYEKQIGNLTSLVQSLSLMKRSCAVLNNEKIFHTWMNGRGIFLEKYTHAFNYEEERYYDPKFELDTRRF